MGNAFATSNLVPDALDNIELTALRNEMREWQGRRFILVTVSASLVAGVLGLELKAAPAVAPWLASVIVSAFIWVVWLLTWYAHHANEKGAAYIRVFYPSYRWERALAAFNKQSSRVALAHRIVRLHTLLSFFYLFLALGHIVVAYYLRHEGKWTEELLRDFGKAKLLIPGLLAIVLPVVFGTFAGRNIEERWRRVRLESHDERCASTSDEVVPLGEKYNYLAPDGSEIRLLQSGAKGGLAHCVLPAGTTSAPVRHRTVEELWYVLSGSGEVWRRIAGSERVDTVREGDSLRIPVGNDFQFRADGGGELKVLIATMPPWPGASEAASTSGRW